MEGARPLNIEEEKKASRKRVDLKRAEKLAERLFTGQPGGSTLEEYMVAGLERWPGMGKEQHAAIMRILRNRIEGEDEVSRSKVVELKIWLRTEIKEQMTADPTANPKAPDTFALAQDAGVASVSYDTFRTQYFYPIRDEVREELGIPKPVRKGGKKAFKTQKRQESDEKKARERKENAEAASEILRAEVATEKLAREGVDRIMRGGEAIPKEVHPVWNDLTLFKGDAWPKDIEGKPTLKVGEEYKVILTPSIAPDGSNIYELRLAPHEKEEEEEHSTEAHLSLRKQYERNRDRFVRDDLPMEGEGETAFPVDDETLRALDRNFSMGMLVEGRVRAKIGAMLENQRASLTISNEDGWMEMHRPESGGVFLDIHADDLEAFDRFMELLSLVLKPLLKV